MSHSGRLNEEEEEEENLDSFDGALEEGEEEDEDEEDEIAAEAEDERTGNSGRHSHRRNCLRPPSRTMMRRSTAWM